MVRPLPSGHRGASLLRQRRGGKPAQPRLWRLLQALLRASGFPAHPTRRARAQVASLLSQGIPAVVQKPTGADALLVARRAGGPETCFRGEPDPGTGAIDEILRGV